MTLTLDYTTLPIAPYFIKNRHLFGLILKPCFLVTFLLICKAYANFKHLPYVVCRSLLFNHMFSLHFTTRHQNFTIRILFNAVPMNFLTFQKCCQSCNCSIPLSIMLDSWLIHWRMHACSHAFLKLYVFGGYLHPIKLQC